MTNKASNMKICVSCYLLDLLPSYLSIIYILTYFRSYMIFIHACAYDITERNVLFITFEGNLSVIIFKSSCSFIYDSPRLIYIPIGPIT